MFLRHTPFENATVPRRTSGVRLAGQCSSPSALNTRTGSLCAMPRAAASSGWMCSIAARSRSSPSVDEIVFSVAGEMSASGKPLGRGIRLVAVQARGRVAGDVLREQVDLPIRRQREDVDELDRRALVRRRRDAAARAARRRRRAHAPGDPHQRLGIVFRDCRCRGVRRARRTRPRWCAPRRRGSITGRTSCSAIGP